jgi:hypothetical protein
MNPTLFIPAIITCFVAVGASATTPDSVPSKSVGTRGVVGCLENPRLISRLEITKPGLYENIRIDAGGRGGNIVKITADDVILRNCEIFNGTGNGIGVFGTRILIENCRIHHLLAGSYEDQHDAHGITGRWGDVTIRNCDISQTSGDSIQFDPDRQSHGSVIIEDCRLWTGPLEEDAPGFKAGQRPGENAVDTKVPPGGARSKLVIRNCHFHGWNQPSQIENMAALNLKENVDAEIIHCVFEDNEIALRLRGPGKNGGARVTVVDCAIYDSQIGVRAEDKIEFLKIDGLAFGGGVTERVRFVNGRPDAGYSFTGEAEAPDRNTLLKGGFPRR